MRVLVIDDSPVARVALRGMLEVAGFAVLEAGDGREGLSSYRRKGADVVLCDLFMPDLDGMQVIRQLREESPDVKIIAMSGGGANGNLNQLPLALRIGADEILFKPFGRAALLAAIDQVLQKPAWTSSRALDIATHGSIA